MSLKAEQQSYFKLMAIRDRFLAPVARTLARGGVSPLMITTTSLVLMVVFIFINGPYPAAAFVLTLIYLLFDMLDGAVARIRGTASDKGKLIDLTADIVVATLFMVGLIYSGRVPIGWGMLWVLFGISSRALRIVHNSRLLPSDWRFRAVAGFFLGVLTIVTYLSWVIELATGFTLLKPLVALAGLVYAFDSLRGLIRLTRKKNMS